MGRRPMKMLTPAELKAAARMALLAGMALVWVLLQEWAPMTAQKFISCAVPLTLSCGLALFTAMCQKDAGECRDTFLSCQARHKLGMPLPQPGTCLSHAYRAGFAWLALDVLREWLAAIGYLAYMPWGLFALIGRYAAGWAEGLLERLPEVREDPEARDSLALAGAMAQAVIAAGIAAAAWFAIE